VPGGISESLEPHRNKLIFPAGLRRVQTGPGGHESAMVPTWTCSGREDGSPFGGYANSPSVDQIIAANIPQDGIPFPSLQFGVMSDARGANSRLLTIMSYAGSNEPIPQQSNPYEMFNNLMLSGEGEPDPAAAEAYERLKLRRQSALDLVRDELRALSTKIGYEDRAKVEQHVTHLGEIERRLNAPQAPPIALTPDEPRQGIDLQDDESFPEILEIQNSLVVAALSAQRTRVASLMWGRSFSLVRHMWVDVNDEHHTLSHEEESNDEAQNKKQRIETWFMQRMTEFLTLLDSVPEGDGTLLDNMMIIYTNELSSGARHRANDDRYGSIALVAGSAGGQLSTGRYLELEGYDWANLLCTACQVMGATMINRVGDMGNEGDLPELYA
jgi:hypothetical protein